MSTSAPPKLAIAQQDPLLVEVTGTWHVHALAKGDNMSAVTDQVARLPAEKPLAWDLSAVAAMDHIGAQVLWNAWGKTRPAQLTLTPRLENFFNTIEEAEREPKPEAPEQLSFRAWAVATYGAKLRSASKDFVDVVALIGQLALDFGRMLRQPLYAPWKEISAHIYHIGYQALGITALVGLLIGVVLSYLSAQQLHTFGGDVFLVNILGMSIIRELGPMLAAILVAGRSGSSITAQLGVMRVTEELDAMLVMGLSHSFRLVLPRMLALALVMPLLVIWTDAMALIGGMIAARLELGLSPAYFLRKLPDAVALANYWIGLGKGVVFGSLIALVASHFGLRIKANTESLGQGTTTSVVTAITIVIIADAVFAIVFNDVGY
ncbi:MAG TPA: ABC transporter permease [Burkholderiaceae bacterium]